MKRVAWLASVTGADEARMALAAGADIIDAKNPAAGALGALPMRGVLGIVAAAQDRVASPPPRADADEDASGMPALERSVGGMVSATVGDLVEMQPPLLRAAALDMAATGVDIVKLGLFPAPTLAACIDGLAGVAARHKLVGVLFADRLTGYAGPDALPHIIARLAAAGWFGVMLDTADKHAGGLLRHCATPVLRDIIALAHQHGLHCGLAGSQHLDDIPALLSLAPDMLGFRGALCSAARRTAELDPQRLAAVARAMQQRTDPHASRDTTSGTAVGPCPVRI